MTATVPVGIQPPDVNEDIKNTVSIEAKKQIKEIINTWGKIGSIIGSIIVALIGFFGYKGLGYYVREYVEKTVEKKYEEISREQKTFILNYDLGELKKQVAGKKMTEELAIEKINQKISVIEKTENDELLIEYLDYLIYLNFILRKYKEIASIVKKYGKDYSLSFTSWANSAISNMDLYRLYGAKEYKVSSLELCENALQKLPGYGTAQAVKLLIGIIDYDKVENKEEKEKQQKAIMQILKEVNSGTSPLTSYETFEYLERAGKDFKKYVDSLFEIFPDQMSEMKQRYMKFQQETQELKK